MKKLARCNIICETCGKSFLIIKSKKDKSKYCSHECYYKALKGVKRGFRVLREVRTCLSDYCTQTFECRAKSEQKFCSRKCHFKYNEGKNMNSLKGKISPFRGKTREEITGSKEKAAIWTSKLIDARHKNYIPKTFDTKPELAF